MPQDQEIVLAQNWFDPQLVRICCNNPKKQLSGWAKRRRPFARPGAKSLLIGAFVLHLAKAACRPGRSKDRPAKAGGCQLSE